MKNLEAGPKLKMIEPSAFHDEFLFRLYASTREEEVASWGWNKRQQETFLRMQFEAQRHSYALQYPSAIRRIAVWEEEPVGQMVLSRAAQEIVLVDLSILPEYRNKGLGTYLIGQVQLEARQEGRTVKLQVLKTNCLARRLYERLGFGVTGERDMRWIMEWSPLDLMTGVQ